MRQGQLGLSLRDLGAPRQSSVALTLRAVSDWVDHLPMANTGESARQVYQFLLDLNTQPLDAGERLRILQVLARPVGLINDALRKHYIGQSVSLNDKQRKIAALAQAMQSEMAIGHKTAIEDMLGDGQQAIHNAVLVPALHGATHYLSLVLLRCYQLYAQQPSRLWKELHTVYLFAEQNNLHNIPVNGAEQQRETVLQAYLRILLTAAANPYQLRQREIESVFAAFASLSSDTQLESYTPGKQLFFIDLQSDLGPQNSALGKAGNLAACRSLQLDRVVLRVQEALRDASTPQLQNRSAMHALGGTLLRHLVRTFGNLTSRAFSRTPASGTIRVAIGLSATHFLISADNPTPAETRSGGHGTLTLQDLAGSLRDATLAEDHRPVRQMLERPGAHATPNPFDRLYRPKEAWESEQGRIAAAPPESGGFTASNEVRYDFSVAALINVSPGGYCLALRGSVPVQTQTGEIVGLMEQDADGSMHWNIGTIRWMKRVPDGTLHIGIQMIAPNARPVYTQVRSSQSQAAAFQRALLLPALKGIGQPATLITSPLPYTSKQKVRVKDAGRVYDVRLGKQVAASASFRQFQFDEAIAGREEPQKADDSDSFDSVWELL